MRTLRTRSRTRTHIQCEESAPSTFDAVIIAVSLSLADLKIDVTDLDGDLEKVCVCVWCVFLYVLCCVLYGCALYVCASVYVA